MGKIYLLGGLVCLLALPALAGHKEPRPANYFEVTGKLKTGIVARGGETTGITLSTPKMTYELEIGKNAKLREQAEKLNGKTVVAVGTLRAVKGVEVGERWIITVTSLKEAPRKK